MQVLVSGNMAFIKEDNNIITYATFIKKDDFVIDINRVFTATEKRGLGLAKTLMDGLYLYVKKNNLKVIPTCPYAIAYFERYKDKQDVLVNE